MPTCAVCSVEIVEDSGGDTCDPECEKKLDNIRSNFVAFNAIPLVEAVRRLKAGGEIIQTKESISALVNHIERFQKIEKAARLVHKDLNRPGEEGEVSFDIQAELYDALL